MNNFHLKELLFQVYKQGGELIRTSPSAGLEIFVRSVRTCHLWQLSRLRERLSHFRSLALFFVHLRFTPPPPGTPFWSLSRRPEGMQSVKTLANLCPFSTRERGRPRSLPSTLADSISERPFSGLEMWYFSPVEEPERELIKTEN